MLMVFLMEQKINIVISMEKEHVRWAKKKEKTEHVLCFTVVPIL